MQVARAGCRARGCGQSGGSWPWRVCSSRCGPRSGSGRFRAVPGNRRRRLRILLHTAHVVGEPAVGVRVADGSGCHRRSGPEGRVLRVDEVTVYAGAQVREAIDEAVVDDHACCGALWAPTSARLTAATMAREGGWAANRQDVHAVALAFQTWPALTQGRIARQVGWTQQYAGKVRAQGATVAPCRYVWSAKAASRIPDVAAHPRGRLLRRPAGRVSAQAGSEA